MVLWTMYHFDELKLNGWHLHLVLTVNRMEWLDGAPSRHFFLALELYQYHDLKENFNITGGDVQSAYLGTTLNLFVNTYGMARRSANHIQECIKNIITPTRKDKFSKFVDTSSDDLASRALLGQKIGWGRIYQHRSLSGIALWLINLGRFNIHLPVAA